MSRFVTRKVKISSPRKIFKTHFIISFACVFFGFLIGSLGVDYLDDEKNKKKWQGSLLAFGIQVVTFTAAGLLSYITIGLSIVVGIGYWVGFICFCCLYKVDDTQYIMEETVKMYLLYNGILRESDKNYILEK